MGFDMENSKIKIALGANNVSVCDVFGNLNSIISKTSELESCDLIVFPELSLSGASCGDMFLNESLLNASLMAIGRLKDETRSLDPAVIVGLPLYEDGNIFNCAVIFRHGEIIKTVKKQRLDYSEKRVFTECAACDAVFELKNIKLGVAIGNEGLDEEYCSDLRALGAQIIVNPYASYMSATMEDERKHRVSAISSSLSIPHLSVGTSPNESTTDGVYADYHLAQYGAKTISEHRALTDGEFIVADIDLNEPCVRPIEASTYNDEIEKLPFIPSFADIDSYCENILKIQAFGLKKRITHARSSGAVIGISGGLDSTLALLATVRAFDLMGKDRRDILCVTMPCFGTTQRTKNNAVALCEDLGVDIRTVNIAKSVLQHFEDIGHDKAVTDVTFENSQARERTQVLMDIANRYNALVIGTGDMSELALGWATYNGDHMSMYGLNASIPKTLVKRLVAYEAERLGGKVKDILSDIIDTPVSPELLPANNEGKIAQKTEDLVGPYELHDFFLYHFLKYNRAPKTIYRLACDVFEGDYEPETILKWLKTFVRRFFISQFKRSCVPDGPAVTSLSLSPRGAFAMPSDASFALFMKELEEIEV